MGYAFQPHGNGRHAAAPPDEASDLPRWATIHRLVCPLLIFLWCFNPAVLDPTNIGWIGGDVAQNLLGWVAFRFDAWRWPLGITHLLAYPHGIPVTATDSNALASILLKPFSALLPRIFQFQGPWYLLSLVLSYNIAFGLVADLTKRRIAAIAGALVIAAAPVFIWRWGHATLTSQWLVLGALSVFLRRGSDRAAIVGYGGLQALAIAIHPYFVAMIFPFAGMDLLRRAHRRMAEESDWKAAAALVCVGVALICLPALLTAWVIGLLELTRTGGPIGYYTMDPLAWFNPFHTSAFLGGWQAGGGQYEGYQYLGLGGLVLTAGGLVLWLFGVVRPPPRLARAIPWMLPALIFSYLIAVSPVVTVLGHTVISFDGAEWPVVGTILSGLRSSGRLAWPVTYFILLLGVCLCLSIRGRVGLLVMCAALVAQILDMAPLVAGVRTATAGYGHELPLAGASTWRGYVDAADRVYLSPRAVKDLEATFAIGEQAFPRAVPLNRFYFAQGMTTRAEASATRERDDDVANARNMDDSQLYVIDPEILGQWMERGIPLLKRVGVVAGHLVVPPAGVSVEKSTLAIAPPPPDTSLYELVADCHDDCAVAIAVQDDARHSLSDAFVRLIDNRGGRLSELAYRGSYAALIVDGRVVEDSVAADRDVDLQRRVFGNPVTIRSGGNGASNTSSIRVNGIELSPHGRGINLVVLKPRGLAYVGTYDTHADPAASAPARAESAQ